MSPLSKRIAVALLGLPLDVNSSYLRGAAGGPAAIRQVLHSGMTNWSCENGLDLSLNRRWQDSGDLALSGLPSWEAFTKITEAVEDLLAAGKRPLCLGGDHSITFPVVRALAHRYPQLSILHLDAHPDLYDDYEGNPYSHASPFTRIMENHLAARLVQVGIRTISPPQRKNIERFGVEVTEMKDWQTAMELHFEGPVYLSLDLDVLDPSCAPGLSHHEPGGCTTRQLLNLLQGLQAEVVGADIVELNPSRDLNGMTAAVGAKLCKELLAKMLGCLEYPPAKKSRR